jgi:hypothetical protein
MDTGNDLDPIALSRFPETDVTGDIDLSLIDYNLSLTPAERIRQHLAFARFVDVVRKAGAKHYGVDARSFEATE